MNRPINIFVKNVMLGKLITVRGGMQVMSYIDPEDVATAIYSLILLKDDKLKDVYNIGNGWLGTQKLLDIAKTVIKIGHEEFGYDEVELIVTDDVVYQHAGLDITRIQNDTGWKPSIDMNNMIRSNDFFSLRALTCTRWTHQDNI